MTVGANGIALSYIIRKNSVPDHKDQLRWGEKSILAVPRTGNKYKLDALVVHNITTRNMTETSRAYTYIKPKIKKKMADLISKHSKLRNITQQCKICISTRPRKRWRPFPTEMKGSWNSRSLILSFEIQSKFWIATVAPFTTKTSYNCCGKNWTIQNLQYVWPQSNSIIAATAKNIPIFCKKFPSRFQLAKHHHSQRLVYRENKRVHFELL